MFNTEIIHFLQGLNHPIVYGFMWFISALGVSPVALCLSLSIAFGLDLRRGLLLLNIVAWTAFSAALLKSQFDFPTPIDIDPSIEWSEESSMDQDLSAQQPTGFFQGFSPEILEIIRNDELERHGFPSSRMAVLTAFWLSFLLLFKKEWILKLSAIMIFLGAIASMYMGYSFLADVLGGIVLGTLVTLLCMAYVRKTKYLRSQTHDTLTLSFFWLPWLMMPFAAYITYWHLASTLGLNMAVIFIVQRRNFPVYHVITWKRVLAALLVIASFLAAYFVNRWVDFIGSAVVDFLVITLINFLVVLAILSISRRLYLIKYRLAF